MKTKEEKVKAAELKGVDKTKLLESIKTKKANKTVTK